MKTKTLCSLLLVTCFLGGCASQKHTAFSRSQLSFLSDNMRNEIRKVEKSVVGINTQVKYDIQKFDYELYHGSYVLDPSSPVKYKLHDTNGNAGILHESDVKTLSGGGLLIDIDQQNSVYTLITSSHLVSPQDTTDIYYVDANGVQTDLLYARYIVTDVIISVVGTGVWRADATLISSDPVSDLAIIQVKTANYVGFVFPNAVGYGMNLSWGDWVFIFGYPKGVKQMTGGWISKAPYRGTLAVDAVVRFGFSGGPVFAVSPRDGTLSFVGVIKSVPRRMLNYITHDGTLPPGYHLKEEDVSKLLVKEEVMVEYGTAYFVAPKAIRKFFQFSRTALKNAGIDLASKYFGQ